MKCKGKITNIDNDIITVVLFTKTEEIYGEVNRALFPTDDLFPGLIFNYNVNKRGKLTLKPIKI